MRHAAGIRLESLDVWTCRFVSVVSHRLIIVPLFYYHYYGTHHRYYYYCCCSYHHWHNDYSFTTSWMTCIFSLSLYERFSTNDNNINELTKLIFSRSTNHYYIIIIIIMHDHWLLINNNTSRHHLACSRPVSHGIVFKRKLFDLRKESWHDFENYLLLSRLQTPTIMLLH